MGDDRYSLVMYVTLFYAASLYNVTPTIHPLPTAILHNMPTFS